MKTAIYPGSFDPLTYGHIDVIKRGVKFLEKLIVAIAVNESKKYIFSSQERYDMMLKATEEIDNVEVVIFEGMIVDFVRDQGASVILRGIRNISDFEYEFQMALINRQMAEDVETIFVMPDQKTSFFSSKLTKEVAVLGGPIEKFVPDFVAKKINDRLSEKQQ